MTQYDKKNMRTTILIKNDCNCTEMSSRESCQIYCIFQYYKSLELEGRKNTSFFLMEKLDLEEFFQV
jgi:hypothetical protein